MYVTIKINCDNDAFFSVENGIDDQRQIETASILRQLAAKMEQAGHIAGGALYDGNGNKVGSIDITE